MEPQALLNISFGCTGILFGYIMNCTRQSLVALQSRDEELAEKVQKIEVIVAGEYVKRTEMDEHFNQLLSMLRRIEEKLDKKVDK
ncbi:MAG: hypothetical protein DRQ47_08940 [Gammaproteobacteria bacterium]|nr:MAG: hypothetical protein DRQ47_08940 [Gammaproteobacteria bacterium]